MTVPIRVGGDSFVAIKKAPLNVVPAPNAAARSAHKGNDKNGITNRPTPPWLSCMTELGTSFISSRRTRTYDQVPRSLTHYPHAVSPNHHSLALTNKRPAGYSLLCSQRSRILDQYQAIGANVFPCGLVTLSTIDKTQAWWSRRTRTTRQYNDDAYNRHGHLG
jgi:hypothetical protein